MKFTAKAIKSLIFKDEILYVNIYPTDVCNLQCKQCGIWKIKQNHSLNYSQMKIIIDKMHDELDDFQLGISGGEPFANRDLLKAINYAIKLRIRVTVNTNGTLIDSKIAEEIIKHKKMLQIIFSLDGNVSKLHDYLRGKKGVFDKVISVMKYFKENGFTNYGISSVINKMNSEKMVDLVNLAKILGVKEVNFQPIELYGFNNRISKAENFGNHKLWPDDKKRITSDINRLIKYKNANKENDIVKNSNEQLLSYLDYFKSPFNKKNVCSNKKKTIFIGPVGDVRLCSNQISTIGNIFDGNLKEILNSNASKEMKARLKNCSFSCKMENCNASKDFSYIVNIYRRVFFSSRG